MSFLKDLGSFIGEVAGDVIGGTVKGVGNITGSEFIHEIGDGVQKASYFAGEKLGEAASGTWDIATGIVTQDDIKMENGLNDMGTAIGDTAKAAGNTICNVVDNGTNVVGGLIDGDTSRATEGAKGLVKFGVIGALSFGIIDLVDGVDGMDSVGETNVASLDSSSSVANISTDSIPADDVTLIDNPNSHHVEPHLRTLPDGTTIWVDGDGDSSVDTFEGWNQSNPAYRVNS